MKILLLVSLMAVELWAQGAGAGTINIGGIKFNPILPSGPFTDTDWSTFDEIQYKITRLPNGTKVLTFAVYHCLAYDNPGGLSALLYSGDAFTVDRDVCTPVSQAMALTFAPVQEVIGDFLNDDSDAPHKIVYAKPSVRRSGSAAQSVTPPDPYMVCLDGLGNTVVKFDLATGSTIAQVTVPNGVSGPLAIRPASTAQPNEVWMTGGSQTPFIAVADLGAQTLVGNISLPSLPSSSTVAGIAFSNDGATAYEAVKLPSADASGNLGAVLVLDAATRTLTSTLLMKFAPVAFVMSPDGLTAYLLDSSGRITYYDTLSGTADFTTSTYTPGQSGGYPGSGAPVFIHPDGTRLFWSVGTTISSFDLTAHKVTVVYTTGLPTTSAASIVMSADGKQISMGNGNGDWVAIETIYGHITASGQDSGATQTFIGPAR
jgi:hypothetical protein